MHLSIEFVDNGSSSNLAIEIRKRLLHNDIV